MYGSPTRMRGPDWRLKLAGTNVEATSQRTAFSAVSRSSSADVLMSSKAQDFARGRVVYRKLLR
jgi:hypothetical protein